jgi:hypothetical protein
MFAILTEHFAGKWPYWLSPRQVMIVPISEASSDYAFEVKRALHRAGHHVQVRPFLSSPFKLDITWIACETNSGECGALKLQRQGAELLAPLGTPQPEMPTHTPSEDHAERLHGRPLHNKCSKHNFGLS